MTPGRAAVVSTAGCSFWQRPWKAARGNQGLPWLPQGVCHSRDPSTANMCTSRAPCVLACQLPLPDLRTAARMSNAHSAPSRADCGKHHAGATPTEIVLTPYCLLVFLVTLLPFPPLVKSVQPSTQRRSAYTAPSPCLVSGHHNHQPTAPYPCLLAPPSQNPILTHQSIRMHNTLV